MSNQYGGSRPPVREDDKRLRQEAGYAKNLKMRFLKVAEEVLLAEITPRQRVEIILVALKNREEQK